MKDMPYEEYAFIQGIQLHGYLATVSVLSWCPQLVSSVGVLSRCPQLVSSVGGSTCKHNSVYTQVQETPLVEFPAHSAAGKITELHEGQRRG